MKRTTRATGVRILTRNLARTRGDQDMRDSILTDVVEISCRSVDLLPKYPESGNISYILNRAHPCSLRCTKTRKDMTMTMIVRSSY